MNAARAPARALAASSQKATPADAVLEASVRLRTQGFHPRRLGREDACALVFASASLARDATGLSDALADVLGDVPFLGFVGASAFHDARLRERKPGLAVLVLPGVRGSVHSAALGAYGATGLAADDTDERAAALLADAPRGTLRFVSLAVDPQAPGTLDSIGALDDQAVPLLGGFSVPSAGARPSILARDHRGTNRIALLDVDGVRPVLGVAQAARPLGPARTVTAVTNNVILELDGMRAFDALVKDLPAAMKKKAAQLGGALCAGLATEDGDSTLVKNVLSVDRARGAVAVAAQPRVGSEIVFSLRDGRAARDDLDEMLRALKEALGPARPRAFVLFSCVARDEGLFGAQCYDAQAILARFGTDIPVVGCSTAGELCTYGVGSYLFGTSCAVAALL